MKIKIEIDMTEVLRNSGDPVYTALSDVFNGLVSEIAEPGAFEGVIRHGFGSKRVAVGKWELE